MQDLTFWLRLDVLFIIIIIVTSYWNFYTSISCWFFIGAWVIACLLMSPGLFLVFCLILIILILTCLLISKSSSPFTNPLGIVVSVPMTISVTVISMFHSFFFSFLARSRYLSLFLLSFNFTLWSAKIAKSTI